jgi:hypothetical protein
MKVADFNEIMFCHVLLHMEPFMVVVKSLDLASCKVGIRHLSGQYEPILSLSHNC